MAKYGEFAVLFIQIHTLFCFLSLSARKKTKKQKGENPIGSTSDTADSFKSFVVNIIPSEYPTAVYAVYMWK